MAKRQKYLCPLCRGPVTNCNEPLEVHHKIPRLHGGDDKYANLQLVHADCHNDHHKQHPVAGPLPTEEQLRKEATKRGISRDSENLRPNQTGLETRLTVESMLEP